MSRPQFDVNKFEVYRGLLYYDGEAASRYRIKQYNKYVKNAGKASKSSVPKQYKKYFGSKTRFNAVKGGHLVKWAKPLTLRGGANPNFNWGRGEYRNIRGKVAGVSSSQRWGASLNSGHTTLLIGSKQWVHQLDITIHALYTNAEHFRILVGQRAIKVFQNSFRYRKFYSNRTHHWKALSAYTLRKRAHRGTGSRILFEYGDLHESFKLKERVNLMTTRVYTDIVPANATKHKKHAICYAGYHNEGKGTYGKGWKGQKPKPYIRRQFMGHSTHLDPYQDSFMKKMMNMYLFDSVFLVKQG